MELFSHQCHYKAKMSNTLDSDRNCEKNTLVPQWILMLEDHTFPQKMNGNKLLMLMTHQVRLLTLYTLSI